MDSETLRVESKISGCFHGEFALIELGIDKGGAWLTIGHLLGRCTQLIAHKKSISPEEAKRLLGLFLRLAQTPQKYGGDRSTTVYEGNIEWGYGSSKMKWHVKSSESLQEEVNELFQSKNSLPIEVRQKIEQGRIGYFNLAHELHAAVMKITKEYSQ
ncbi:MAG TPA: hypothetical protein VF607_07215 [Verrucomicrobiae bacterium]